MFPKSRALQDICLDMRMDADTTIAKFSMDAEKIINRALTKGERKMIRIWNRVKKAVRDKLGST